MPEEISYPNWKEKRTPINLESMRKLSEAFTLDEIEKLKRGSGLPEDWRSRIIK